MTPTQTALHKSFATLIGKGELDGARFVALIALGHEPERGAWWALTASVVDRQVKRLGTTQPESATRLATQAGMLLARAQLIDPEDGFVDDVAGLWRAAPTPMRELALGRAPWSGDASSVWAELLLPHDQVVDSLARLSDLERAYVIAAVRLTGDPRANLVIKQFLTDPSPLVRQALGHTPTGDPEPSAAPSSPTRYSSRGTPMAALPPPPPKRKP